MHKKRLNDNNCTLDVFLRTKAKLCQSAPDVHFLSVFPFDLSVLIIFLILSIFNFFTENCLRKLLHMTFSIKIILGRNCCYY